MAGRKIVIAVTGTPASGKTTFAKELAGSIPGAKIIEINDVVDQYKLFSSIDKLGSKIVKLKELEANMTELMKKNKDHTVIIVGHLVPELKLNQDITVVLRIGLRDLIKRLEARGYQKEKIKENIVSESIDYCGVKSREVCRETYEVETKTQKDEITDYILAKIEGKEKKPPETEEISKFNDLLDLITDGNNYGL